MVEYLPSKQDAAGSRPVYRIAGEVYNGLLVMYKSYKVELNPSNKQSTLFKKSIGASRFAWNWALNKVNNRDLKPLAAVLNKELNSLKRSQFPWMYEVSNYALGESIRDLEICYKRFFNKIGKHPRYRRKSDTSGSYRVYGAFKVDTFCIKIPKIGWVRLKEKGYIPSEFKILSATVSREGSRWFVSLNVEEPDSLNDPLPKDVLGIDLGVKSLATCSDGFVVLNQKVLRKYEKKIAHSHRKMTRQKKGSVRRKKTQQKLAKLHFRVRDIRKDYIHKATTGIVKTKLYGTIVFEKLNIKGMVKNHKLAKSIHDASMGMFKSFLSYKQKWAGGIVLEVSPWFPSSKMCSRCGYVKEKLSLSERIYHCEHCGLTIDRDLNAAINLRNTAGLAEINDRGDAKVHVSETRQVSVVEAITEQGLVS